MPARRRAERDSDSGRFHATNYEMGRRDRLRSSGLTERIRVLGESLRCPYGAGFRYPIQWGDDRKGRGAGWRLRDLTQRTASRGLGGPDRLVMRSPLRHKRSRVSRRVAAAARSRPQATDLTCRHALGSFGSARLGMVLCRRLGVIVVPRVRHQAGRVPRPARALRAALMMSSANIAMSGAVQLPLALCSAEARKGPVAATR